MSSIDRPFDVQHLYKCGGGVFIQQPASAVTGLALTVLTFDC